MYEGNTKPDSRDVSETYLEPRWVSTSSWNSPSVWLGSKYTLNIELPLDRFGQSNKFRKKSKKKFRDIQQMTPHLPSDVFSRSSRGYPENVLGTSRINSPGTYVGRQIRTFPRRHFEMSPGRQFRASLGWSDRIFRRRPGDVRRGRPETIICRLGIYCIICYCHLYTCRNSKCKCKFFMLFLTISSQFL